MINLFFTKTESTDEGNLWYSPVASSKCNKKPKLLFIVVLGSTALFRNGREGINLLSCNYSKKIKLWLMNHKKNSEEKIRLEAEIQIK